MQWRWAFRQAILCSSLMQWLSEIMRVPKTKALIQSQSEIMQAEQTRAQTRSSLMQAEALLAQPAVDFTLHQSEQQPIQVITLFIIRQRMNFSTQLLLPGLEYPAGIMAITYSGTALPGLSVRRKLQLAIRRENLLKQHLESPSALLPDDLRKAIKLWLLAMIQQLRVKALKLWL